MGLISGSGSFTRYIVTDILPDNFMEKLPEMIVRYSFKNFDETSTQERSIGWVNIMNMFDNKFQALDFLKEPYIAMSLRIDEKKIPATAVKQHCIEAEEKIKKEESVEFLSRKRRANIKDTIKQVLMKRAIPVARTYNMVWNYSTGAVIFGGTTNKLCDEFTELFFHTFSLQLQPVCPYTLATKFLEENRTPPDIIEGLHPFKFLEKP